MKDSTIRYYDRTGQPISSMLAWAKKYEERDYKIVKQTVLDNGKWVSTVWVGIDHAYGLGPPLIFETMIFAKHGDWHDLDCYRYSTEAEALAGHEEKCLEWASK